MNDSDGMLCRFYTFEYLTLPIPLTLTDLSFEGDGSAEPGNPRSGCYYYLFGLSSSPSSLIGCNDENPSSCFLPYGAGASCPFIAGSGDFLDLRLSLSADSPV